MINSKFIGGVLLIVGTSIGGGMLALPVSTAGLGFTSSVFFLCLCWLIMTLGALLILEVNLHLPAGSNIISMARWSLGRPGQIFSWVSYLFLLYALLAAYISGGSDVLNSFMQRWHSGIPFWISPFVFTFLFSFIIYGGIQVVDYMNRGLMLGKLSIYCLLILFLSPHIHFTALKESPIQPVTHSLMILVTSFGFASIVPSLRNYFSHKPSELPKVILIGSLIPLVCYIAWNAVIMGIVNRGGEHGLMALFSSAHPTSGLIGVLNQVLDNNYLSVFFNIFTSICMVTAFLGVALSLYDFLADGLKLKKKGMQGRLLLLFTFLPPLISVLFMPGLYLYALNYAGFACVLLLLLLPVLMSWRIRYRLAPETVPLVPGGKLTLSLILVAAIILIMVAFPHAIFPH